jgi:hypothetical protein
LLSIARRRGPPVSSWWAVAAGRTRGALFE